MTTILDLPIEVIIYKIMPHLYCKDYVTFLKTISQFKFLLNDRALLKYDLNQQIDGKVLHQSAHLLDDIKIENKDSLITFKDWVSTVNPPMPSDPESIYIFPWGEWGRYSSRLLEWKLLNYKISVENGFYPPTKPVIKDGVFKGFVDDNQVTVDHLMHNDGNTHCYLNGVDKMEEYSLIRDNSLFMGKYEPPPYYPFQYIDGESHEEWNQRINEQINKTMKYYQELGEQFSNEWLELCPKNRYTTVDEYLNDDIQSQQYKLFPEQ